MVLRLTSPLGKCPLLILAAFLNKCFNPSSRLPLHRLSDRSSSQKPKAVVFENPQVDDYGEERETEDLGDDLDHNPISFI